MKAAFTANFIVETIIETDNLKIDKVDLEDVVNGNHNIGYVAFNKNNEKPLVDSVVTPFTSAGELEEACCAACAARALFASYTKLPLSAIDTGTASQSSVLKGLIMASIIKSTLKH